MAWEVFIKDKQVEKILSVVACLRVKVAEINMDKINNSPIM